MATEIPTSFVAWSNPALERAILGEISLDVPWAIVERFASLVRSSGSSQERAAIDLLIARLREWSVPHQLHELEAFISIPLAAHVRVGGTTYHAKTPAMSVSTGGQEISGDLVYLPSSSGSSVGDVFSTGLISRASTYAGKSS